MKTQPLIDLGSATTNWLMAIGSVRQTAVPGLKRLFQLPQTFMTRRVTDKG